MIPRDVHVFVSEEGRHGALVARQTTAGADGFYSTWAFPLGPRFPFVPSTLSTKLAMMQALQAIQHAISTVSGKPWPKLGYKVRAKIENQDIRLWFENSTSDVILVGTFPNDLAG